jgi:hypothetical protein
MVIVFQWPLPGLILEAGRQAAGDAACLIYRDLMPGGQ